MFWRIFTSFFFLISFSFSAHAQSTSDVMSQISGTVKALHGLSMQPQENCALASGQQCSFNQMCASVRPNRNSKNLYRSSDGRYFPNFNLIELKNNLKDCASNDSFSGDDDDSDDQDSPTTDDDPAWDAQDVKNRKQLMSSVAKNHEELKYVATENALLDIAGDDEPGSLSDAKKNLMAAEKKAGVQLSSETFNKWTNLMVPPSDDEPVKKSKKVTSTNPYLHPELLIDASQAGSAAKLKTYRAEVQKDVDRAYGIFQDNKQRIVAFLQTKRTSENAASIDGMIARIETIKFAVPQDLTAKNLSKLDCSTPNAFYDPSTHTFNVCPQVLNMPTAALQEVMAHEMGHSIDPCTMSDPLFALKGKAVYPPHKKEEVLHVPAQPDGQYLVGDHDSLMRENSETYSNLELNSYSDAVGLSKNPLSKVVTCLGSSASVGARMADMNRVRENLLARIDFLKTSGATEDTPEVKKLRGTVSRLKNYDDKKACSELPGKSEMQEAFADYIASEVTASKVRDAKTPEEKRAITFEAAGFFLSEDCAAAVPDISAKAEDLMSKGKCNGSVYQEDMNAIKDASTKDEHPDADRRVNRILLAHPDLQNALGCTAAQEGSYCGGS